MSGDVPTTDGISPGPWKVYPSGHSAPGYDVCDRIISDSWTGRSIGLHGMSDADARLIAAAPDLLKALQGRDPEAPEIGPLSWLRSALEELRVRGPAPTDEDPNAYWEMVSELEQFVSVASAAIKKATGEQS